MRGCVEYNDLWPWPISSRSFGLGLENRVRSVASTVPDGFFPYLAQMITSIRRCVACDDLWPWPISSRSFDLVLTWDPTWLSSVGNHVAAGGLSSERRHSSCSNCSCILNDKHSAIISISVFHNPGDHSVYGPSQWELALYQNTISHGLDTYINRMIPSSVSGLTRQSNNYLGCSMTGSLMLVWNTQIIFMIAHSLGHVIITHSLFKGVPSPI